MARPQVLLVDDERRLREVVTLLSRIEIAVGALPDRSGLEVLIEIRSARPWLPVVMMTGYGSEALCASALRLGVRDYFPKPVNIGDLLDAVRRLVPEAPPPAEEDDEEPEVDGRLPVSSRSPAGELDLSIQKAIRLIQLR